jgi:hypothetical protein
LWLELTRDDLRRLRRTAALRPSEGYTDVAAAIVANTRERKDGSGWSELSSGKHIRQFVRQRETGTGGSQSYLQRLSAQLDVNGSVLTQWAEIVRRVEQTAPRRGRQLVMSFEMSASC